MATATRLSLEEFHRLYDGVKPYYEYWFGEASQKPSRGMLEGLLTAVVGIFLHERCWKVATSVTLKMSPNAELIPDVIATRRKIEQPHPTQPIEICVEILSVDYGLDKGLEKGKRYLDWGVEYVWIINPVERTAWMVTREHPDGIRVHPDGKLTAGEDTEIPLTELFAEVDKVLQA